MAISFENHTTVFQTGGAREVELGRIEPVSLQTVWRDDPSGFTRWLSSPDSLALLGSTLDLELELVGRERSRDSLVCREIGRNHEVLISFQLDHTESAHLGDMLTRASEVDAFSVVWIARSIADGHRSCLDWLNRVTLPEVRFYGVEMELWRIESSKPAPKFNVVARPYGRSNSTLAVPAEPSATQFRYWSAFHDFLLNRDGAIDPTKPCDQGWMSVHPFRRGSVYLNAATLADGDRIGVSLEVAGEDAANVLDLVAEHRVALEGQLGELTWGANRVSKFNDAFDPSDEASWGEQHEWLARNLESFAAAFGPLVEDLD